MYHQNIKLEKFYIALCEFDYVAFFSVIWNNNLFGDYQLFKSKLCSRLVYNKAFKSDELPKKHERNSL